MDRSAIGFRRFLPQTATFGSTVGKHWPRAAGSGLDRCAFPEALASGCGTAYARHSVGEWRSAYMRSASAIGRTIRASGQNEGLREQFTENFGLWREADNGAAPAAGSRRAFAA